MHSLLGRAQRMLFSFDAGRVASRIESVSDHVCISTSSASRDRRHIMRRS